MEDKLFEWEKWDIIDEGFYQFQVITLKRQIGSFVSGTKFEYATIHYAKGLLGLYANRQEHKFKLSLKVGEKVT